jgi:SAM-dependent methyltransferase
VSDWTDGYVADIDYTYGYYAELNPLRTTMPLLNVGLAAPTIGAACELGFGQGISVNIHAAASRVAWYGTDFNPSHAALAQSLAAVSGADAKLFDQSFAEFCNRTDLPDFDYIALHGIWSWISAENQQVIVDFLRRKLKVGGILYVSYNTQPGFAAMVPFRRLLMQHAEMAPGTGRGVLGRIDAALSFAQQLLPLNPIFAVANPTIGERLKAMQGHNRNYLAHEYFNRDWCAMLFSEMAEKLSQAKLGFACSAHYLDHIDAVNLSPDQQKFLSDIADPQFRQTVRDFVVNQQFRRDYWIKGPRRLPALEQAEALRRIRLMLVVGPRTDITFSITSPLGTREMNRRVYDAVLDVLADYQPKTMGELEQALGPVGLRLGAIYEAIMVLAGKGDVAFVQDDDTQQHVKSQTDRYNQRMLDRARADGELLYLATPVTGGGIAVPRFYQLFLLARQQGQQTVEDMARFAWDILAPQGQRLIKDGKTLDSPEDNLTELTNVARDFADKRLPMLQVLKVA